MQVTELKKDGLDFHVRVTIPSATISDEIHKELVNLTKKVRISGFRAGKIPLSIITKKYGESVRNDIIGQQINKSVTDLVKQDQLKLAISPDVDGIIDEANSDLQFTVKFELIPIITIPHFNEILIEKPILNINDQDIDKRLDVLVQSTKLYEQETSEGAVLGDQVTLSAVGCIDSNPFDGGKLENYKLVLGSKAFIDNFEEQLIGSKAGDNLTVKVTFPANYHVPQLATKPAEFNVNIIAVHTRSIPAINDDFAKKFGCDNVEKLREKLSTELKSDIEEQVHSLLKMRLFNKLEYMLSFDAPPSLVDREYQFLSTKSSDDSNNDSDNLTNNPIETEAYYRRLSLRRVRIGLLLSEYARSKNLTVTQDDVRAAIIQQMQRVPSQAKALMEFYQKNRQAVEALHGPILEEKAVRHIFEHELSFTEKTYSLDELEELLDQDHDISS